MRNTSSTKRFVSATAAKSRFGSILAWVTKKNRDVVIGVYGKSKAAVMSYREYRKVQKLWEREQRRMIWEKLEVLRRKVSARSTDVPEEERYRMAGMSIIEQDAKLAKEPE